MTSKIHFAGAKGDLKRIFSIVNSISDEAIFEFRRDRIIVNCHDKSITAYLDMKIKKDYFEDFDVRGSVEVGFNISEILKVIDMCTGNISISINEEILLISKSEIDVEAHVPQIHIESEEIVIPQHNYTTSAFLKVEYFKNYLPNLLGFSKFVEINVDEKIRLKVSSSSGNHITVDVPVEQLSNLNQKDRYIVVDISIMNKLFTDFDKKGNIQLKIDESLPAIELTYEEDNLYIRSLFNRLNRAEDISGLD
jgi:hypothetical protein